MLEHAHPIARSVDSLDGKWREVAERVAPMEGAAPEWAWHLPRWEVDELRGMRIAGEAVLVHAKRQGVTVILAGTVAPHLRKAFLPDDQAN